MLTSPAAPCCISMNDNVPVTLSRANTTALLPAPTTYAWLPSGLSFTPRAQVRPSTPSTPFRFTSTKVSDPVVSSRENTATALSLQPVAYTCLPSGLTVTPEAPPSPSTPPTPSRCTAPDVSLPVAPFRAKAATALSLAPATYRLAPSGLTVTAEPASIPSIPLTPSSIWLSTNVTRPVAASRLKTVRKLSAGT